MRIVCGSCSAKYSIADGAVGGKVYRTRCKRCGEVLVIRCPAAAEDSIPPQAAVPATMTGARNESSVLFSLANVRDLATSRAPRGAGASVAPGQAAGEGSGLVDIRALVAAASQGAPGGPCVVDDLVAIGGCAGLSPALVGPVMAPLPGRGSRSLLVAAVGVGALVAAGVLTLAVALLLGPAGGRAAVAAVPPPSTGVERPAPPAASAPALAVEVAAPAPAAPVEPVAPSPDIGSPQRVPARPRSRPGEHARDHDDTPRPDEARDREARDAPGPARRRAIGELIDRAIDPVTEPVGIDASVVPGSPAPEPGAGAEVLPLTPTRAQVRAALNAVAGSVRQCGEGARATVMVDIVVDGSSGAVSRATADGDHAGPRVGACAASAVRAARFPRFRQSTFTVRYPFVVQ